MYVCMYIYIFTKIIEIFWSNDTTNIWVLVLFELKTDKDFYAISSLYVLNCFKYFLIYILGKNVSKN